MPELFNYSPRQMRFIFQIVVLFFACATIQSCKKIIVDEVPVYDYHEISIPNVDTIYSISFPTTECGYAVTNEGMYKTLNAGDIWNKISSINYGNVHFITPDFGVTYNGRISTDGGISWTPDNGHEHACISSEGRVYATKAFSNDLAILYQTEPFATNYIYFDTLAYYGIKNKVNRIEYHGDYLIIFPDEIAHYPIYAYDYVNSQEIRVMSDWLAVEEPTDLYVHNGELWLCGGKGYLGQDGLPGKKIGSYHYVYPERRYYDHTYPFNAIDNYNEFAVAVGDYTIATNKKMVMNDGSFKEVLSMQVASFPFTFYLVDVVNQEVVITVANGARIFYGKI